MSLSRNTHRWAAVAAFVATALLQIVIFVAHGPGREMTSIASVVPGLLMSLWLISAIGLVLHRSWALPVAVISALCAMGQGAMLRLGNDPFGFGMLLLGAASLVFSAMAHRELYVGGRHSLA